MKTDYNFGIREKYEHFSRSACDIYWSLTASWSRRLAEHRGMSQANTTLEALDVNWYKATKKLGENDLRMLTGLFKGHC